MGSRNDDIAWFLELLAPAGKMSARSMFGGTGLYADGVIIALEVDGALYLKTDAETRARFEAGGGAPFVYGGKGEPITTSYWTPPDEALDSPDAMRPWALLAVQAAQRKAAAKPKRAPRKAKRKFS